MSLCLGTMTFTSIFLLVYIYFSLSPTAFPGCRVCNLFSLSINPLFSMCFSPMPPFSRCNRKAAGGQSGKNIVRLLRLRLWQIFFSGKQAFVMSKIWAYFTVLTIPFLHQRQWGFFSDLHCESPSADYFPSDILFI